MSEHLLRAAADALREALDRTDDEDRAGRLEDRASTLEELADRDRGADHGRLARETQKLRDIESDAEAAVAERTERARDLISEFREDVEGV